MTSSVPEIPSSAPPQTVEIVVWAVRPVWGAITGFVNDLPAYQQAENYLIQPAVMRQAVELSGFATIAVVMVGGAVLAVPVAASVKIVLHELTEGRRTRMAALSEAPRPAASS